MIKIWIGDKGEVPRLYAAGDPVTVAKQFAVALCMVHTDLAKHPIAAELFKTTIRRLTADDSPVWRDEEMKDHLPEGTAVVMECLKKDDGKSESGGR